MVVDVSPEHQTLSDADFRTIVDELPHIVWTLNRAGTVDFLNHCGRVYLGLSSDTAGADWAAAVHPDDRASVMVAVEESGSAGSPYRIDCRIRRWDGEHRWHRLSGVPVQGGQAAAVTWIGMAEDIDDTRILENTRRHAARENARTLALLETLQSKAPVGFGFVDRDFRRVLVNETLAAFNGSTVAEQVGRLVADLTPSVWPTLQPLYQRVLDTGEAVHEIEVDGTSEADPEHIRHWLVSYYPVKVDDEVIGIGVVAADNTDRIRSERAHRLLSTIVENSGDAIFSATTEGIVTSWNAGAVKLFGFTPREMIGTSLSVLADKRSLPTPWLTRLVAGGPTERYETVGRRRDGTAVDVLVSASASSDGKGTVTGLSLIVQDISERVAAQRALVATGRQLTEAQRISGIGSFEVDPVTFEMSWSEEHYRVMGLERGATPTRELFLSMVNPDDLPGMSQAWDLASRDAEPVEYSYRITRPDTGEQRTIRSRAKRGVGVDGVTVKLVGTVLDDTDRPAAELERRTAESRFEVAFEQAGIGAGILDLDGRPIRVNAAGCAILGRSQEELSHRSWTEFHHPDEVAPGVLIAARQAQGHDTSSAERRFLRPDGSVVWTNLHMSLVRRDSGAPWYYLAQMQDITERKLFSQELAHQALHDALTGLPNRALLTDRLMQGLIGTRRPGSRLGVILLDIDHFKVINVASGHTRGDELLVLAAARLEAVIREGDTIGRFGGDEFVIVCDDVSVEEALHIATRILDAMRTPFFAGAQETTVTGSIGIAMEDDGATPETLLRDATAAVYLAKSRGRDRIELFDDALRAGATKWMASTSALRNAVDREEFFVQYQPVVDLRTGVLVGAEALIRWRHPDRGVVPPDDFIPVAEETGMIVPIGAWVLEQACRRLARWQQTDPALTVAVNLSVRQIESPGIVEMVADTLTRNGIAPVNVCLEVTESVFMADAEFFGETLRRLRALGVRLSIDDFGTGYSSLSYLKRFPVDAVKVDKAFIDGLGTDPHDSALVAAIVAMADALDLTVTAEGVETAEQLEILRELQCARGQGYHLARPMTAADMDEIVRERHRWPVG